MGILFLAIATAAGAYIILYKTLLIMQYGFYFGSRGIEKVMEKYNTVKERVKRNKKK